MLDGLFFNPKDRKLIKKSLYYVKPYKVALILAIIATLFGLILGTLKPLYFGKVVDFLTNEEFDGALKLVFVILFLVGGGRILNLIETFYMSVISNKIVSDLRKDLYNNILKLPVIFFDQHKKGEFISRFESDINSLADILTVRVAGFIVDVFRVIIVGIIVYKINFTMAVFLTISFPISYLIVSFFGKKIKSETIKVKELRDQYLSFFQESLMGIKKIKELNLYKVIEKKMFRFQDYYVENSIHKNKVISYSKFSNLVISVIMFTILLSIGIKKIESGLLTIGGFVSFNSYANLFQISMRNIVQLNSNMHETLVSIKRIFELISDINYQEEDKGKLLKKIDGRIKFDNVTFGYKEENILKNLKVEFSTNQLNVIVGYNGAGKTTLFNLLLGFYNPEKGNIFLDNMDIRELNKDFVLKNIAYVSQEPFFFNVSIKENLKYANNEVTDESIVNICKKVKLHKYIESLPAKYDTIVGEMGDNLSGGQKKRLAIARAIIKNSKIFLCDEPMASVDRETKEILINLLRELSKKQNVIIISHDLEIIKRADKIYLFDEGEKIAQGEHNILLESNYIYKNLFSKEFAI